MTLTEVMAEPAALEEPKARAVNERHGDDHGVPLGKPRALAKRIEAELKDDPTSAGRTSPFAPVRIAATARRRGRAQGL